MIILTKHTTVISSRLFSRCNGVKKTCNYPVSAIFQQQQQHQQHLWNNLNVSFNHSMSLHTYILPNLKNRRRRRPAYAINSHDKNVYKLSTTISNKIITEEEKDQTNHDKDSDNDDTVIVSKKEKDSNNDKNKDNDIDYSSNEKTNQQPRQYTGIFPKALDDNEEATTSSTSPRKKKSYLQILKESIKEYKETYKSDEDIKKENEQKDEEEKNGFITTQTEQLLNKQQKVSKQVKHQTKRNIIVLRQQGKTILKKVQNETGIYTKEDLKELATELLKIATKCTSEFMNGYRNGRDEEINRVLNEYFKELEDKDNKDNQKKRRRKIRKRDLTFLI